MFLRRKGRKDEGRRRSVNRSGVYDVTNFILGLLVILLTFVLFIDSNRYEKLFTAVFLLAAAMNICMGIKYWKRNEIIRTMGLMGAGAFLIGMTVVTLFTFW